MIPGTLFVVPVINAMGPVTDSKHQDLLNNWDTVNTAFQYACSENYRLRYPDSQNKGLKFSLFCISWSGFKTNPVQRDFGWHTIFDNYKISFKNEIQRWGDAFYWMYNHPPTSGVGNEWGLDWLHNTHYLNILNHFIIDRAYFPNCVEIPTERNDTSHFLENYIPFDFSNRNSKKNNLNSVNADGKRTGEVLGWEHSPADWSHYHPDPDNYQQVGNMQRTIFRIVDIQSIVHMLGEEDIELAFQRCQKGHNTILCAYEHDFRDRYEVIMARMIAPVHKLKTHYPNVKIIYETAENAARKICGYPLNSSEIGLNLYRQEDLLRISTIEPIFGREPYTCLYIPSENSYTHIPLVQIGYNTWQLPKFTFQKETVIGVGVNDRKGQSHVRRWRVAAKCPSITSIENSIQFLAAEKVKHLS
jgi:hypothetical protein